MYFYISTINSVKCNYLSPELCWNYICPCFQCNKYRKIPTLSQTYFSNYMGVIHPEKFGLYISKKIVIEIVNSNCCQLFKPLKYCKIIGLSHQLFSKIIFSEFCAKNLNLPIEFSLTLSIFQSILNLPCFENPAKFRHLLVFQNAP